MTKELLYCPALFFNEYCMPLAFWTLFWQSVGVLCTLIVGGFGIFKIYVEVSKIRNDKENQKKLEQTKFFLEQHRRLFDDPVLFEILSLIDAADTKSLSEKEMIDKKRKFLTFLEEVAILHSQNLVSAEISFYMFGYYALTTKNCTSFWVHFDTSEEHWGLFYKFVADFEESKQKNNSASFRPLSGKHLVIVVILVLAACFSAYVWC